MEPDKWAVDCTSPSQVVDYLIQEFDMDETDARMAVDQYDGIVQSGVSFRSHVDYVGDQVADAWNES